jgi:actin-related protein 8
MIIDDIETILETSLQGLDVSRQAYKVFFSSGDTDVHMYSITFQDYSAVLVIPDYYDRPYVRDMIQLLLVRMGFKQLCVQQVTPNFPQ